jgi:predicted phage tail protein
MSTEAKDTLRSKAILAILDLLGEGPIGGLINGDRSVFFNDTQLQNDDGTYNFQGVTSIASNGHSSQNVGDFGNYIETPYNIGTQIKVSTPYTFSIVNPMADAVRVIVNLPSLSTTNTSTGDVTGATVQYKFQMSLNNGPFVDVVATQEWKDGGTWSTSTNTITASALSGASGVRASCKLTLNLTPAQTAYTYGTVQAQEFNGIAWVNLGAARKMTVQSQLTIESRYTISSETFEVQSNYSQVRFVLGSHGTGVSLVQGTITSNVATPTITISGKSRSKYQRKHIINIPRPANSVEIRMVRITADSTSAYLLNETYLDSYYEIIKLNMAYPFSALYGFSVDSQQFNQIPSRAYLVDGLLINVPTNYNPTMHTYTGVWNGQFKKAVSSNPAWIMYDILTNKRYGLGNYLTASQIDKAALYTIGRYCDEMVSDGFGGMEPRFTLNTVINSREDAYKVISDIASAFRGMSYWSGGMACFTQDSPTDPTMIYGRANVVNGEFNYTGSARKDRHSVVHVTWNDPAENYKKKIEYVEDPELIQLYGVRKQDTLAFGCASRGQAARVGKWILYTEKYESDFITFKVGIDSAFVQPGNVIKIQDPSRAGRRVAGRLKGCEANRAVLDAETQIDVQGTISLMMPNGTFVDRVLNESDGAYTVVTWDDPLDALPEANAMWLIQEEELVPILARVVGISQAGPTEFEITAVEHNPAKYAAIEQGLELTERRTSIVDPSFVHTPAQLTITEAQYLSAPGVIANKLLVSWFGDSTTYQLTYKGVSNTNYSNPVTVTVQNALTYEIPNIALGTYEFTIVAINPLGRRSSMARTTYDAVGKTTPPSDVATFVASGSDQGIKLEWSAVPDIDLKAYEIRQCEHLKQYWEDAPLLTRAPAVSTSFTLPPLPVGSYMWEIKALDTSGRYSNNWIWTQLDIQAPSAPAISATFSQGNCKLTWSSAKTTFPIEIYEVRVGPSYETGSVVGRTTSESLILPATWGGSQTFWVSAIDTAGNTGSAGMVAVNVESATVSSVAVEIVADRYRLTWGALQGTLPVSQYEIRVGEETDTWASATALADLSANSFEGKINWSGVKRFFVAAIDMGGNVSASASTTLSIGAPAAPVMTSAISGTNLTLTWATPALGSLALDQYELRTGTGSFASASVISELKGNSITLPVTWVGNRTFQIVAKDVAGNASDVGQLVVPISAPSAPVPAGSFLADMFTLQWSAPSATLPIAEYEVRFGTTSDTWASTAATAIRVKATVFSLSAQWSGMRRWWVAGIDANGNVGADGHVDVTITAPSAPVMTKNVVDNNVLLYWSESSGSLPVATYELRRGAEFDTAANIGKKSGGFTTVFETAAGVYTYWLVGIDTAGNYGTPASLAVTVDQPPDYILKSTMDLTFTGAKYHMTQDADGGWIMPVNTTETFAEHFSTHGWESPTNQVDAGYPVFIEPANSPGYYEEEIDYGTTLTATKITVTPNGLPVAGSPLVVVKISVREHTTDAWTDYDNTTSIYVASFRYAKIRVTVIGGGTDLYKLHSINVKLDTKQRNDAGMGSSGASDAVSGTSAVINGVSVSNANPLNVNGVRVPDGAGTLVRFNTNFVDVMSIDVSVAAGSSAKFGLYDFVDTPYAAGFKVVLYDKDGNRVGGNFSWSAKGQ